jgi:hypothetical protein
MEYQGCGNQGTCIYLDLKELKAKEKAYVYVCLERSYDPPEGHPRQQAYIFVIRKLLSIDVSHLSFNFLCLLLL